jgi:hypothetical protein
MSAPGPPPPVALRSRAESRRFIEQELDRRYAPERLERERKALVAWGLVPPDYELRRLFVDLMNEQLAAYYDPRGKSMVLGDWLAPAERHAALLHELVHALQDRELSLERFLAPGPGQGDQLLARQALIEGEAVGLMLELLLRPQGVELAALPDLGALRAGIAAATVGPVIQQAPRFLRELLLFPYVEGLHFVHQFRRRQPWAALAALYRDPPRSTSQILHPERRLDRRQDPLPVALPAELDARLAGWPLVSEDELGEFALGFALADILGDADGRAAAASWRGDRYRIWEDPAGGFALAYRLAVADPAAAGALAARLTRLVERRHPALAGRAAPAPAGAPLTLWRAGDRVFLVEHRGAELLLLERIPAAAADRVREAAWRDGATR